MSTLRETKAGDTFIKLEARDQYNDYSVIFDHTIVINYASGRSARYEVGTDVACALAKYEAAVRLARDFQRRAA